MQTVYVDVLIILNTYVNFALLRITGIIGKRKLNRLRLFLGALLGGIYSLVILLDGIPEFASFFMKLAVCGFMVLVSYGGHGAVAFIKDGAVFLGVSFAFAGIMLALWLFKAPEGMLFNNGEVYFRFDIMMLLVFTVLAYAAVRIIYFFGEKRAPKGSIYDVEIFLGEEKIYCRGLCDSGNGLRDYFTSLPVILVSPGKIKGLDEKSAGIRLIPCSTVTGNELIPVIRPQKVRIRGTDRDFFTKDVLIGISKTKINNGEFDAILPFETVGTGGEKCVK